MPAPALHPCSLPHDAGARILLAALLALGAPENPARASEFVDPLDAPTSESRLASRQLLNAVALAGKRLVAVGQRGHVLFSDDGGRSWSQAPVPVSADLTAVHFPTPERGWAVGHDGVVLATADGGRSWRKQLDGRQIGPLLSAYYGAGDRERVPGLREQLEILAVPGADKSFLDVWFADERTGFAAGAFNLVLRTDDGGEHWVPWLDRMENPRGLHVYAVRAAGGDVFAVGEQGLVRRLAPSGAFEAVAVPYRGSLFGVAACGSAVVAFGMRGTVLRSADRGRTWRLVPTGVEDAITGAATTPDGRLVLVTQGGTALASPGETSAFGILRLRGAGPASSLVAAGAKSLVLVGPSGVRLEDVP